MNDANGYAVFFFPHALEALGEAIKPYLHDGPGGDHVLCNEIDTSGQLIEMTMQGSLDTGAMVTLELMVPSSMVRMIVSSQSDAAFGFRPRIRTDTIRVDAPPALPPIGPTAEPANATPAALPNSGVDATPSEVESMDEVAGKPAT
jgi:hypothetical protein